MTLQGYLRVLRERWIVVTAFLVIGLICGIVTFVVRPVEYTAQTSLYVSAQNRGGTLEAFQAAQLSAQRVVSYTQLATSPRVTSGTIRRLSLNDTPEQLAQRLTATSNLNSVIIDITATDSSSEQAVKIADTVGTVTSEVVDELERPSTPGTPASVNLRVVQPAQPPDSPSSVGLTVSALLGLVIGLLFGIGAAIARNSLDTSIRSAQSLAESANTPNLAVLQFDERGEESALPLESAKFDKQAETYRQLRTNLQFIDVDNPKKTILITSSLPAEGKTTAVVRLARVLSAAGNRVLIIDADLRRPRIAEATGLDGAVGLTLLLAGRARLDDVTQRWQGSLDVLTSGPLPPNPSELLQSKQMRSILEEVRSRYDFVLLDSPPVLSVTDAVAISTATDGTLLLCRYEATKTWQVGRAAEALRSVSTDPLGTILTMAPANASSTYGYASRYGLDATNEHHRLSPAGRPPSPRPRASEYQDGDTETIRPSGQSTTTGAPPRSHRR